MPSSLPDWQRLGDVVLHVLRLGRARDSPVAGDADGDADQALVVLVVQVQERL